jgi:hypothetical protein
MGFAFSKPKKPLSPKVCDGEVLYPFVNSSGTVIWKRNYKEYEEYEKYTRSIIVKARQHRKKVTEKFCVVNLKVNT